MPPDLDRLRAWAEWNDQDPYSTGGPAEEAARFLLSAAKSGGRLVAEQPCEHGAAVRHRISEALPHVMCPGGSRMQVWPDKEEK